MKTDRVDHKEVEGFHVAVAWEWRGQRRRYGDSEYIATLTVTKADGKPADVDMLTIKRIAAAAMNHGNPILDRNERNEWWKPFFRTVSRRDAGVWYVRYDELYTD